MENQNAKVIVNPEFKSAASSLRRCAQRELNVQISIDKLVNDTQYRDTVFNELEGLGSEELDEHIHTLKVAPVYLKPASAHSLSEPFGIGQMNNRASSYSVKKPRSYALFAGLAFIFISIGLAFVWQSVFVQVSSSNPVVINKNSPTPSPVVSVQTNTLKKIEKIAPRQNLQIENVGRQQLAKEVAAVEKKDIILPVEDRKVTFRLHGSNTVGEHLAPALLEAYLKSSGVKEMLWVQGEHKDERELQYVKGNQAYAVELQAHGSSTGFRDLLNGSADMIMSSRQIKEEEVQELRPLYGNLGLPGQEYIVGLDGLSVIVNQTNPVNSLTIERLAKVFSGEINNWKALGGPDLPITLVALDENSGTWDTFKNLILEPNDKQLNANAERLESSSELSDYVAKNPGMIGFVGLPYIDNSKAISIASSEIAVPIYPTSFTVQTEDYPLTRRLYVYAPSMGNDMVRQFVKFAVSQKGQNIVEQVGLVSQNLKLESVHKIKDAPKVYNDYAEMAKRLSVNFRFKIGSNELDNKAKTDVSRLFNYFAGNHGLRIVLMGFSDAVGDESHNVKLSLLRANLLEQELTSRGLNVAAVEGFGAQLPVASNRNALGRSKNRRVEVWAF